MATFTGQFGPTAQVYPRGRLAVDLGEEAFNYGGAAPLSGLTSIGGPSVVAAPIDVLSSNWTGGFANGANDYFYDRIVIEPGALDVGNLLSSQTRSVRVWNAYRSRKDLTSFTGDAQGIIVTEPVTAPYEMRALQVLNYVVNITTDGPPVIDEALTWVIDGEVFTVPITGSRVLVFPISPNWKTPVIESLEWRTNVLRAYDGSEQRRALRRVPRRTLQYNFLVKDKKAKLLDRLLWGWQNRMFAVPLWQDKGRLSAPAAAGATTVSVGTATLSYAAGSLALLFRAFDDYEAVEVQSVSAGSLGLKRPLERAWEAGTLIYPVLRGHLPTDVPLIRHTDNAVSGTLLFSSDPSTTDAYLPTSTPAVTYKGLEVVMRQPNWKNGVENTSQFQFETLDSGIGQVTWLTTEEYPRITRQYGWLLRNRAQVQEFRAFLGRRAGQSKLCWVPSWHDDLTLVATVGSADVLMRFDGTEFARLSGDDPQLKYLMITLHDSTNYFREIISAVVDGNQSVVQIDTALGRLVKPQDVKRVSFLLKCRLASDKIEIPWQTDHVADPNTPFTTVPA